jgi:hypothetical protein
MEAGGPRLFQFRSDPPHVWTGCGADGSQVIRCRAEGFRARFTKDGDLLEAASPWPDPSDLSANGIDVLAEPGFAEAPVRVKLGWRDPDFRYVLRSVLEHDIWTGRTDDARQVLFCPISGAAVIFCSEGRLLESRFRRVWGTTYEDWRDEWRRELSFIDNSISVRRFEARGGRPSLTDFDEVCEEFLKEPDSPSFDQEERDNYAFAILVSLVRGESVLNCNGNWYDVARDGSIFSS